MRPDLPWNVAGIPSEAREAARAAARREGQSIGEWLTRRILAGLSDVSELQEPHRDEWSGYRSEDRGAARRDSEEMLDRVSRSETETAGVYRRMAEAACFMHNDFNKGQCWGGRQCIRPIG